MLFRVLSACHLFQTCARIESVRANFRLQTAVSPHPLKNWTRVYMNLFTRKSPYYHLLKYLLFLLKHPVYIVSKSCPLTTDLWRVASSTANKQSKAADKGWFLLPRCRARGSQLLALRRCYEMLRCSFDSGQGQMVCSCEHGDELSGSVTCREFIGCLENWYNRKRGCSAWRWFISQQSGRNNSWSRN